MPKAVQLLVLSFLVATTAGANRPELQALQPFFKKHCYGCHGPEKQKGDIRLDTLGVDLLQSSTIEIWQGVLDQLNLGEMPPKKEPQPTQATVKPVVDTLTVALAQAYEVARSTGGETVLRRLNRHELRNTLRDLLHLQGAEFRPDTSGSRLTDNNGNGSVERSGSDPLRFFPEDEQEDGFSNLGDTLVMSDFLLKLTLDAVEEALAQATHLEPRPEVETRRFAGHLIQGNGQGEHVIETVSRDVNPDYDILAKGYERFGRVAPTELRGGIRVAARYRITVEASAHNSDHPYRDMIAFGPEEPFQLCLNIADTKNGGIAGATSTPLELWSLPGDGSKHTFTSEAWLDKTWTPWIGWENGPDERTFRIEKLVEHYLPDTYSPRPDKAVDKAGHESWSKDLARLLVNDGYEGPHLRIHSLTVEPLIDAWPPESHTALYGKGTGQEVEVRTLLLSFAQRVFRQPVEPALIEPYVQLVLAQQVEPVVQLPGGLEDLTCKVYEGKWSNLPDFDTLKPVRTVTLPKGYIDLGVAQRPDFFGLVFEGSIRVPRAGSYVFEMASDDAGRMLIDGKTLLEHDGLHGAEHRKAPVELEAGPHAIRVEYVAYGLPNSFRAGWGGPGIAHVTLSTDSLVAESRQVKKRADEEPPLIRAMKDGYAAMLCSPQFLYLQEPSGRLDDFGIANRLSYFLWSSMPDETLFELARSGRLTNAAVRREQVTRMLKDPKAAAFVHHFPATWLRLDQLGKMPPSGGDYQFYKNLHVEPMLYKQVTTYFGDVLERNGPIEDFIASETTFMNHTLAKWIYKREDIRGERLRKVTLDDPRRGGIFTLPGIMTATANGVETSPVIRGTWLLDNVLGTPPPPPPPDVEPLPTNTRDATTVRELLALHRKNDACNSCHVKIDPMGFPFENFDVVGRWRDQYKGVRGPIDTSAVLANGEEIADIVEFKQMLMKRKPQIVRSLTTKMLTYATGRKLEAADRGEVDRIVHSLTQKEGGLQELVQLVVQSELFLSK
ncbi:MAG: hypothetical protein ACI9QL_005109 [Candidatus Omnitrophota bacterium]|jgi:hypothetical protein